VGLRCKRCGSEDHVKNGLMRTKQRYRCKACGLNFTDTPARGKPLALKVAAVLLYVSGLSMNRTAKLLGVSLASHPPPSRPGSSSSRPPTPRSPSRRAGPW
jgi:transposase